MNRQGDERGGREPSTREPSVPSAEREDRAPAKLPPEALRVRVVNLRNLVFWAGGVYLILNFLDSIVLMMLLFTLGFFLAIALEPMIRWLARRGVSRGVACGLLALLLVTLVALAITLIIPPVAEQANSFVSTLPERMQGLQERLDTYLERYPALQDQINNGELAQQLTQWGQRMLPQIGRYSLTVFNGIMGLILVVIIALYTMAAPAPLLRGVIGAFPKARRFTVLRIIARLLRQYRAWARAMLWLSLIVGTASGIGLWFLGVPNVLIFALIAAFGEVIPVVGPILSAIPPIVVVLSTDPPKALWVALLYVVIQQLENNLLVPRILGGNLNLHAVSVLFAVVTFGAIFGPLGVLLAAPFCATVKILYQEIYQRQILQT